MTNCNATHHNERKTSSQIRMLYGGKRHHDQRLVTIPLDHVLDGVPRTRDLVAEDGHAARGPFLFVYPLSFSHCRVVVQLTSNTQQLRMSTGVLRQHRHAYSCDWLAPVRVREGWGRDTSPSSKKCCLMPSELTSADITPARSHGCQLIAELYTQELCGESRGTRSGETAREHARHASAVRVPQWGVSPGIV